MNWRLGLFRLWLVVSVVWGLTFYGFMFSSDHIVFTKPESIIVHWGKEEIKYPASDTKAQIQSDLERRAQKENAENKIQFQNMTQEQRVQCEALHDKNFDEMSALCINYFLHDDILLPPTDWESQLDYPPHTISEIICKGIPWTFLPSILTLLLGWSILWALSGFRRKT